MEVNDASEVSLDWTPEQILLAVLEQRPLMSDAAARRGITVDQLIVAAMIEGLRANGWLVEK